MWVSEEGVINQCVDVYTNCEDVVMKAICDNPELIGLDKLCVWSTEMEGSCEEAKEGERCELIVTESACAVPKTPETTSLCIWIERESIECQEVKESCEAVTSRVACITPGSAGAEKVCIWIEGENIECQEVKGSCEAITSQTTCNTEGSAIVDEDGEVLSCFWLYSDKEDTGDGGNCHSKDDKMLTCRNAKRKEQCNDESINNFGTSCFWLEGNETREPPINSYCEGKVCYFVRFKFYLFKCVSCFNI
jgi:hypothetical protein